MDNDIMTKMLSALPPKYQVVKEIVFNQQNRTVSCSDGTKDNGDNSGNEGSDNNGSDNDST